MKIIAEIDTLSESRTTPVWIFVKEVEKKIKKLKKMVADEQWKVLDVDETEFRNVVFPGDTEFNLLGRGFKQFQIDELKEDVFHKIC